MAHMGRGPRALMGPGPIWTWAVMGPPLWARANMGPTLIVAPYRKIFLQDLLPLTAGHTIKHLCTHAVPLGSASKHYATRMWDGGKAMYLHGLRNATAK